MHPISTGIEGDRPPQPGDESRGGEGRLVRSAVHSSAHVRLIQAVLADGTDRVNEVVQERVWLGHPRESVSLRGNLFAVEDLPTASGSVYLKCDALPHARPAASEVDFQLCPRKGTGFEVRLFEARDSADDTWVVIPYSGGDAGRTDALHQWQRGQRPATPQHTGARFLTNTWGDRSRDSRICAAFIEKEIVAAAEIGADIVQIDDGWQRGITANSALASGDNLAFRGFRDIQPDFWEVHPAKFPEGLAPLVDQARARGLGLGLWFAPDSIRDFAGWRLDADTVLELHRKLGIEHFKVDLIVAASKTAQENLGRFFDAVLEESSGRVVFDLDITAGIRPGYLGAIKVGPLFLENRYTDWHNYWPHHTFRNLWKLARWIDPLRLRMEFLNNSRNQEMYSGDPLAPACYAPSTLFATAAFANPLGWFEVSQLPPAYRREVGELARAWRACRQDLFRGRILPIGDEPTGFNSPGVVSLDRDGRSALALLFRGPGAPETVRLSVPGFSFAGGEWELLPPAAGALSGGEGWIEGRIPRAPGHVFGRFMAR